MSHTTFNLRRQGAEHSWELGTYLTDGKRLLYLIDATGEVLLLEDSLTECVEYWRTTEAAAGLREVRPCSPA